MLRVLDAKPFDESKVKRVGKGRSEGGEFTSTGSGASSSSASGEVVGGSGEQPKAAGGIAPARPIEKHLSSSPVSGLKELGEKRDLAAERKAKKAGPAAWRKYKKEHPEGHVNAVHLVTFENGSKGVFKPRPTGGRNTLNPEREVSAWEVAKIAGLEDLVAPTIKRKIGDEEGSVADFVKGDRAADLADENFAAIYDGSEDLARAALFDYVMGNTDRHAGNWKVEKQGKGGKLRLFDHDKVMPSKHVPPGKYNHQMLIDEAKYREEYGGLEEAEATEPVQKIKPLAKYAATYVDNKAQILGSLLALPPEARRACGRRIDRLGKMKKWKDLKFDPRDFA